MGKQMKIELSENSKEFLSFLHKKYKLSKSELIDNIILITHIAYLQNPDALDKHKSKKKKSSKEIQKKLMDKRNMNPFDYHSMYNNFSGHKNMEEGC